MVDDHSLIRHGLKGVLQEHLENVEFGHASNAQEALECTWRQQWDLVLLDISLPGRGGLDVLKDLHQNLPKLPVIVLSMHSEANLAVRVLRLGASSYIRKGGDEHELITGVKAALRGKRYLTPTVAEELASQLGGGKEGHAVLSDREYQVLCHLGVGKTVKEVGNELSLSVKTISTYRSRILKKLNLRNNYEIISYVRQEDLVEAAGWV